MSAVLDHPAHAGGHAHDDHHHAAPSGWRRWLFATNHKDIGTLYMLFSFTMLMVGGVLALMIRAELFQPGLQLVNPELFNQLTTMHGLIMVFGAIMPAFVVLGAGGQRQHRSASGQMGDKTAARRGENSGQRCFGHDQPWVSEAAILPPPKPSPGHRVMV